MIRITAVFLITAFILLSIAACRFVEPQTAEPETTTVREYVTDYHGNEVPVFENVDRSDYDPTKFVRTENGRIFYDDENYVTKTGIDVSVFQGEIDWNAVAADGIDYVMLRIGGRGYGPDGALYEDRMFARNINGAKAAGLKIGVYFFSQAISIEEAAQEASYTLELLNGVALDYPIAFDWEHVDDVSARTASIQGALITSVARTFCDAVTQAGYQAVIYFNREHGYFEYELSLISDYPFWYAEYADYPSFVYHYKMWQYTETGHVNGIQGYVDLNAALIPASG